MARLFRPFLFIVLVAGLNLAVAGAARAAEAVPVKITVHAALKGDILHIRGAVTVPDGAWIIFAAYLAAKPHQWRATGYAKVEHGRFAARVDLTHWPPGTVHVDAHFQTMLPERTQPDAVLARFGNKGERMTGPAVVQGGFGYRTAVASTSAVKSR